MNQTQWLLILFIVILLELIRRSRTEKPIVVGSRWQRGKVVFDEAQGKLWVWEQGWIGKRKYRINVNQVSGVMYGWYTSRLRLPMFGFVIFFTYKGKSKGVSIPGENKKFRRAAEAITHAIGKAAKLHQESVGSGEIIYSRGTSNAQGTGETPQVARDGTPLSRTEQVIAGAARGSKNIAGEIVSDVGNVASKFAKVIIAILGGLVILALLGTSPLLAVALLAGMFIVYRLRQ